MSTWNRGDLLSAHVIRVIDGDTVLVDWWNSETKPPRPARVRLAGIDAPELYPRPQPGSVAATYALAKLVENRDVAIIPTRRWPDPYGRMIARVYIDGADVSVLMVRAGHAQVWSQRLRKEQRIRTQGLSPNSASPTRRLITPPARTNGLPVSMPSMRTGTDRTIGTQPHQK
jgi:endonuclease YncB( thermonuclease family)